ncbi:MAG: hypothetical protein EP298_05430 [Gammaproteobacteria bacterium]|nr:MAG: hypothetical protein EP298_05430 [Gammaproteobacteria bacterium]UTW43239.1 hypothetical protein KFE69_03595 [bacterium SCSIO 12844]
MEIGNKPKINESVKDIQNILTDALTISLSKSKNKKKHKDKPIVEKNNTDKLFYKRDVVANNQVFESIQDSQL